MLPAGIRIVGQTVGIDAASPDGNGVDGASEAAGDPEGDATGIGAMSIRMAKKNEARFPAGHSSQPGGGSFVPKARKSDNGSRRIAMLGSAAVAVGAEIAVPPLGAAGGLPLPHGFSKASRIPASARATSRQTFRSVRDGGPVT